MFSGRESEKPLSKCPWEKVVKKEHFFDDLVGKI